MQDLGAEVGQLGGLVEVEAVHGACAFYDARVVVVHAVDVGPDLHLFGADGGAYQGGGVVAAAALQVVNLSVSVAADVAFGDEELLVGVLLKLVDEVLLNEEGIGLGVLVGPHKVEGGQGGGGDALLGEVEVHHLGRHEFAAGQDDALLEGGEHVLDHGADKVEMARDAFFGAAAIVVGGVEPGNGLGVFL